MAAVAVVSPALIVILNRCAVIVQLRATAEALEKLFVLLKSGEQDRFASQLYRSRREYRRACHAGKGETDQALRLHHFSGGIVRSASAAMSRLFSTERIPLLQAMFCLRSKLALRYCKDEI